MLEKFKFIFKDFKKALKYADVYNRYTKNPFAAEQKIVKTTYIWVEKPKKSIN